LTDAGTLPTLLDAPDHREPRISESGPQNWHCRMIEADRDAARPHRFDKALVEIADGVPIVLPADRIKATRQDRPQFMKPSLPFGWRLNPPAVAPSQSIPAKLGIFPRLDRAECVGDIDNREIGVMNDQTIAIRRRCGASCH
jgi:hypothetical protein